MTYFKNLLEIENFDKQLKKLAPKYAGKRIILYGMGKFFRAIQENYDLSCLNIIAVSDYNFLDIMTPVKDEKLGYDKISPLAISTLKPDIVLLSVIDDYYVEKYFLEELFKDKSKKFKYTPFLKKSLNRKISEEYIRCTTNVNSTVFVV